MYSALSNSVLILKKKLLTPSAIFMVSTMVVNGVNYLYNLILGRALGPTAFAEAGLILTLLLVVSFVGMTFQMVAVKYVAELEGEMQKAFSHWICKISLIAGVLGLVLMVIFHRHIQEFFHLTSGWGIILLAFCLPAYFLMSAKRGVLQGQLQFIKLSYSYQVEVWSKVLITVGVFALFVSEVSTSLAFAILGSIILGYLACGKERFSLKKNQLLREIQGKIWLFIGITLGYELLQILINYGDMMIVKHYFDDFTAGLYTSMALIGRMIYFVTWMMVMVLIPSILNRRKQGLSYRPMMYKYFSIIFLFSGSLTLMVYLFPVSTVNLFFGSEFLSFSHLLWKYALATSLFALANLFIYYFISIENFLSVYIAGAVVVIQFILYNQFHDNVEQIILTQVFTMSGLLGSQLALFLCSKERNKTGLPG